MAMKSLLAEHGAVSSAGGIPQDEQSLLDPSEATPEQRRQYDAIMLNADAFLYNDKKNLDNALKQLQRYDHPSKAVGLLSAQISVNSLAAAKRNNVQIDPAVALQANLDIARELLDLGVEAGVYKFQPDDPVYDDTLAKSMSIASTGFAKAATAGGLIDHKQLRDVLDNLDSVVGKEKVTDMANKFGSLAPEGARFQDVLDQPNGEVEGPPLGPMGPGETAGPLAEMNAPEQPPQQVAEGGGFLDWAKGLLPSMQGSQREIGALQALCESGDQNACAKLQQLQGGQSAPSGSVTG